jgi:NADH-quinone oxidoreductase subunit C
VTPEELAAQAERLAGPGARASSAYGTVTVDVPRERWEPAASGLKSGLDLDLLDLVTAVDHEAEGLDVVLRAWSTARRHGVVVRTRVDGAEPEVATLAHLWAGAAWHERHAAEMLGVRFAGHPSPGRLLLHESAPEAPLRKAVLLEARQTTPWPGGKEAGESGVAPRRRRNLPPGVAP